MKLYSTIEALLKKEPNYVTDDGDLKKWVIISKAQNYDAALISLLLESPEVKTHFFIPVKDVLVFNQALFIEFMEQKNYLNDSFTAYKNKIGLKIDGKFLNQRNEVALVWPYKDCVLEGGQSREEDKREEIFFNEVLAQDEINQLLDPKVFTNAKHLQQKEKKHLMVLQEMSKEPLPII
jgi:adenine-specific DNA-methyltransferase